MPRLRIALAQLDLWVGDVAGNAARVIEAASEGRDARVTCCRRSSVEDQPGLAGVIGEDDEPPQSVGLSPVVLTLLPTFGAFSARNICQE